MSVKKYIVDLSAEEREQLEHLISCGKRAARAARAVTRARILLLADSGRVAGGLCDEQIVQALSTSCATVERVRQRFVEEGLEAALKERRRHGASPKLDGRQEAHLIALACSAPPAGRARWSLRLLAGQVVELGWHPSISHETVRATLKKTN